MAIKDRLGKLNETVDRLKVQAGTLAEKAQEQAARGQQRLEQFQGKKLADQLLLELGGLTYLDRQGRLDGEGRARVDSLVDQLQTFEAANGPIAVTRAVPPPGSTGSYVPGGAGTASASASSPADPAATPNPGPAAGAPPAGQPEGAAPGSGSGAVPKASYAADTDETSGPT